MSIRAGVTGVLLASCAFPHGADSTKPDQQITIVDDSAPELAGGTLDDTTVDSLGLLAPEAYAYGGLHMRAFGKAGLTALTAWKDLALIDFGPLLGERYGEVPATNWSFDRPYAVGLGPTHVDNFTVIYDGEIYLPQGPTTFVLLADDFGLFEIELGAISAAAHPAWYDMTGQRYTVSAPHAGWYPLHAALSEVNSNAVFQVVILDGGVTKPLSPDRLRARITAAPGMMVAGTPDRVMRAPLTASSIERTLVDRDFTNIAPTYDLPAIGAANYVLRYTGQLRVEQSDLYVFGLDLGPDTTDYARLVIDGVPVAGNWPGSTTQRTSDAVELAPGWHDVLLDYSQLNGYGKLKLTMSTPTLPTQPIPADRLRPVSRSGMLATAGGVDMNLVDGTNLGPGITMIPFPLTAPSGAMVDFVDYFYWITGNTPRADLQLTLGQAAASAQLSIPAIPPFENAFDESPNIAAFAGKPAGVGWQAVFTDTVPNNGGGGRVIAQALMVTFHGGAGGPFAKQMTYVSKAHPTDGAVSIDAIRVTAKLDGAQLATAIRTGDAGSIEQAPWVDTAPGASPGVSAGTLVEYRLTVISDGWQYPTIDKVEIDYTRTAPD
ncbi:MAG: hypothetical protein JWO36_5374 [Myxococcales bacterium]|nr:hypothetical protein [Myxococcales bacterium]